MVKTVLSLQGTWVPFLVRERRFHMSRGVAKKKKKELKKKQKQKTNNLKMDFSPVLKNMTWEPWIQMSITPVNLKQNM